MSFPGKKIPYKPTIDHKAVRRRPYLSKIWIAYGRKYDVLIAWLPAIYEIFKIQEQTEIFELT